MTDTSLSFGVTTQTYTDVLAQEVDRRFACHPEGLEQLRSWQAEFRAALAQRLGLPRIAQRCADTSRPSAKKLGQTTLDDHVREDWVLEPEPGFSLPFFVLLPLEAKEPRSLIMTPHGHNKQGRHVYVGIAENEADRQEMVEGERDIALQAVRRGHVAIAPQARAFSQQIAPQDRDPATASACFDWQMRALLFGRTLIGERVWDLMKLIDYAQTRDDIDTSRIAITGNSGGGTASIFAAAFDERIGVAVPSSSFCTFADSIGSIRHCACNYVPELMQLAEMADVAALITPRPFLAVHGVDDPIFPIDATRRAFQDLHRIYVAAGVGDRCELFEGDGGHRYYKQPVWPFIERWLNHGD